MDINKIYKYVVNLDRREDRMKSIAFEMNYIGWDYERFSAVDTNDHGGCSLSHIQIIKNAIEKGYDGIMDYGHAKKNNENLYEIICFYPTQIKLADGTNTSFDANNPDIRYAKGGRTVAQTPAPKKERIYGSNVNKPKSSASTKSGKRIIFSGKTLNSIKEIVSDHNKEYPNKKVPISTAKSVVRRGMGAYSSSHRPTISGGKPNSRVAWGLARLNAFIYKIQNGKSKSGKYVQDDDLINELGYKIKNK